MIEEQSKRGSHRLPATRSAIQLIEHSGIRAAIERFADGAEACLAADEIPLALDAVRTIVTTVVALDQTIGPEVTLGILDGLGDDSEQTAVALRRGLGFTKNDDSKCDIRSGTPIGSSGCVDSKNSTCYTLDSGSGCGGSSGRFQFVWELATLLR